MCTDSGSSSNTQASLSDLRLFVCVSVRFRAGTRRLQYRFVGEGPVGFWFLVVVESVGVCLVVAFRYPGFLF